MINFIFLAKKKYFWRKDEKSALSSRLAGKEIEKVTVKKNFLVKIQEPWNFKFQMSVLERQQKPLTSHGFDMVVQN